MGLTMRPERDGSAYQTAGAAVSILIAAFIVGDPNNVGGQAGPVDVVFVIMALPPLSAAASARPWRTWRVNRPKRPRYLALAALSLAGPLVRDRSSAHAAKHLAAAGRPA